jgi:hypothetical protein
MNKINIPQGTQDVYSSQLAPQSTLTAVGYQAFPLSALIVSPTTRTLGKEYLDGQAYIEDIVEDSVLQPINDKSPLENS